MTSGEQLKALLKSHADGDDDRFFSVDSALFRRFDDILHYDLPARAQIAELLKARLHAVAVKRIRWRTLATSAAGLSCAEVTRAADEVLKDALIRERNLVHEQDIRAMLKERQDLARRLAASRA